MKKKTNEKSPLLMVKQNFNAVSHQITLCAILNRVYAEKISFEMVTTKINHQINSMENSIKQINQNFMKKSKYYDKVKEEMIQTMEKYENLLWQFCRTYDDKIEEKIMKKVELETKLLMAVTQKEYLQNYELYETNENGIKKSINHVVDKVKNKIAKKETNDKKEEWQKNQKYIIKLEKELKDLNNEIKNLSEEKKNKIFEAMEMGDKKISVQIRKPRKIAKITKFFASRLNPYKSIMKSVIEPMNQRIEDFQEQHLEQLKKPKKELEISQIESKIRAIKDEIFLNPNYELICKKIEILEKSC